MSTFITDEQSNGGADRRGFLMCMACAGTGVLRTIDGGVLSSTAPDRRRSIRASARVAPSEVGIDDRSFTPKVATVAAAGRVTWVNHDDVPHRIVSANRRFPPSPVLETGERYEHAFDRTGRYLYFCSIDPTLTGAVEVRSACARASTCASRRTS